MFYTFCNFAIIISLSSVLGRRVFKSEDEIEKNNNTLSDNARRSHLNSTSAASNISDDILSTIILTEKIDNAELSLRNVEETERFPFAVALLTGDKEYICSGSVIDDGLVLSAAHCLLPSLKYVMLNSTRITQSENDYPVYAKVLQVELFPTFSRANKMLTKDVGLVITEPYENATATKILLKKYEDIKIVEEVVALGYGLNAESGAARSLQYAKLSHRHMYDLGETFKCFIDCVGTNVSMCFKDTGGAAVMDDTIVGIIVKGENECTEGMAPEYAINKYMVEVLPTFVFQKWVEDRMKSLKANNTNNYLNTYRSKENVSRVTQTRLLRVIISGGDSVNKTKITLPLSLILIFAYFYA